ncbi:imidazolonepropionase [Sphingobacterium haloxyli]|uniref:Imidazolonepropionase n=1 Tax=Sphingobacterium haloxyli TaxID=2100533 RepID=A0A2S9IYG3_9SPHI|nr:imidazolonepropionase [Sphingobacterium haloxyli]PRD45569.1 imidazolonepropionase [Sphingobacterium haloxyli]
MAKKLLGPFTQLLPLTNLPLHGPLADNVLEIIEYGGIVIEYDRIVEVGPYVALQEKHGPTVTLVEIDTPAVCMPSYIDCHTHIAFGGNRANDYALRNAGATYLEIAEAGGGIWSTVQHTRNASMEALTARIIERVDALIKQGITTIEVKSGYGLSVEQELKTLRAIQQAQKQVPVDLVPTCLAAHMKPRDFAGDASAYLQKMAAELFPVIRRENLTNRIDAFLERSAFSATEIRPYFRNAKEQGFDITVHADQFTTSGSVIAVEFGAVSADHLEASTEKEIQILAKSDTVAVALPGASLGLGCGYTPARRLLDHGAILAIATDWNPGSAPMGQLMIQASILAAAEKLSNAEVFAALTSRAAKALNLADRGQLQRGQLADFNIYATANYQNITYMQGTLLPQQVWKSGKLIYTKGEQP